MSLITSKPASDSYLALCDGVTFWSYSCSGNAKVSPFSVSFPLDNPKGQPGIILTKVAAVGPTFWRIISQKIDGNVLLQSETPKNVLGLEAQAGLFLRWKWILSEHRGWTPGGRKSQGIFGNNLSSDWRQDQYHWCKDAVRALPGLAWWRTGGRAGGSSGTGAN